MQLFGNYLNLGKFVGVCCKLGVVCTTMMSNKMHSALNYLEDKPKTGPKGHCIYLLGGVIIMQAPTFFRSSGATCVKKIAQ